MKTEVLYCKSDMHVWPMQFSILCTPTDSSDKTQLVLYKIAVLIHIQIRYLMEAGRTTIPCPATNLGNINM